MDFRISLEQCFFDYDVHYFHKYIRQIISNALSYSPKGESVFISGEKENNLYTISIKDNSTGFPELIVKEGVKAFISTEHLDRNPGLNLYLCKLIIEAHNGSISLTNENGGKGEITIPYNSIKQCK